MNDRHRKEYLSGQLTEEHIGNSPAMLFRTWFDLAMQEEDFEPNACTLATAGADSQPSARIVLLKSIEEPGLVFFTNYLSRKGEQISDNPKGALLFFWPRLERQVRIEGLIERITGAESDSYFGARPRNAQLAASISRQSQFVASRTELESTYSEYAAHIGEGPIIRPQHWGGYRIVPHYFEFWQGRESRLHDRFSFRKNGEGWTIGRLWP